MSKFVDIFKHTAKSTRLVGANCVVVRKNQIVENLVYGKQDIENNIPTNVNTIYRIASISKMVVALAAMKLVEENKLSLYEDIGEILGFTIRNPHFPDVPITTAMLMTQTSSISDGYFDEDNSNEAKHKGYNGVNGTHIFATLKDLLYPNHSIHWTEKTFSPNKPGTMFEYSNFGCGIIACIIEKRSNQLFTEYVKKEILDPLDIDGGFHPKDIMKKELVASLYYPKTESNGYELARNYKQFCQNFYPDFPLGENYRGPAGGLFISMPDLAKIMGVFMNDGLYNFIPIVKKETMDYMLQQHWNGSEPYGPYRAKALQMKVFDYFEDRLIKGHTGNAYGVKSFMFFNKEHEIGICFITNGGYMKMLPSHMYDCHEPILKSFLDSYWPKKPTPIVFSFSIQEDFGFLNGRKVVFHHKPIVKEDIYLPSLAFGEAIQIVLKYDESAIYCTKNQKSIIIDKINHTKKVDDIIFVPIKKILTELAIKYQITDNNVFIEY